MPGIQAVVDDDIVEVIELQRAVHGEIRSVDAAS
jgi:hypothetical protein